MIQLRIKYGTDPHGFYWPGSEQKRQEVMAVKRGAPAQFESTYQCRPGNREGAIFLESDFAYYEPGCDLFMGVADPGVRAFVRQGHAVRQGWDTAYSAKRTSAYTAGLTGLLVPCDQYHRGEDPAVFGPCDSHFDILILDCFRERVDWGGLVAEFRRSHTRWRPERMVVEKKASGISLFQAMSTAGGLPIKGVEAKEGKLGRAILSVGAGSAQGWMRQHRVRFPQDAPWFPALKAEMKDFTGDDDAASDQTDAIVHLIADAIMEGSGGLKLPTGWTPEYGTPRDATALSTLLAPEDPRAELLTFLGQVSSMVDDPFAGTCGRCENLTGGFCKVQGVRKVELDSCPYFADRIH